MQKVQRFGAAALLLGVLASAAIAPLPEVEAAGRPGKITGKSVGAGLLSFFIWPGIGQAVNEQPGKKVATHAVLGIIPPYRFWSGYDALVDRDGGYWEGRI